MAHTWWELQFTQSAAHLCHRLGSREGSCSLRNSSIRAYYLNDPSRSPLIGCILGGWWQVTIIRFRFRLPSLSSDRSSTLTRTCMRPDWLSFSHVVVHIVLGFPLYPSLQNGNCDSKYGTGLLFTIANVMCDSSHTNILETSDSLAFE